MLWKVAQIIWKYKKYDFWILQTIWKVVQTICTGNFETTMDLLCAHNMMNFTNSILHLDLVHLRCRTNRTLLDTSPTDAANYVDNEMLSLLNEFQFTKGSCYRTYYMPTPLSPITSWYSNQKFHATSVGFNDKKNKEH